MAPDTGHEAAKFRSLLATVTCVALLAIAGPAVAASATLSPAPSARAVAVSGLTLFQPADMGVHAGETADQVIHATDPDGDPLTFNLSLGPSYMTVTTIDPGSGSATGTIHLAPSLLDEGRVTGSVYILDVPDYRQASFEITVFPYLEPVAEMTVVEGATADQHLVAHDPGRVMSFTIFGAPPFATVSTTGDSTGNLHLAPVTGDAGFYGGSVTIRDDTASHSVPIRLWVMDPSVLTQPSDMHAVPGTVTDQILSATVSDPKGWNLTFAKTSGPDYMAVGNLSSSPHRGYVRLSPSLADTGEVTVTVQASNNVILDEKSFHVRVDLRNVPPALSLRDIDVTEAGSAQETIVGADPDHQRLTISASQVPRFMTFTPGTQPIGGDSILAAVRVDPGFDDAGIYAVPIHVSDGRDETVDTLHVTVHEVGNTETSLRLGPAGDFDTEYSVRDGRFRCTESGGVHFSYQDTTGLGAQWIFLFDPPGPIQEGDYDGTWLFWFGVDTTASALPFCGPRATSFQIRKITRATNGSILTFWATFQEICVDGTSFHGELRYQVPTPMTLLAQRWIQAGTNQILSFPVTSSVFPDSPQTITAWGRPSGATFTDDGNGHGRFVWTPPRQAVGDHVVKFTAMSTSGATDMVYTTLRVLTVNRAPRAFANGPYFGRVGVPIHFSSAGSSDPDDDSLAYSWSFGDGSFAIGPSPSHAYANANLYSVMLLASDGLLQNADFALATVTLPDSASVAQVRAIGGSKPIRLQAGNAHFCVALETVDVPSSIADIDPLTVRMLVKGFGGTDTAPADPGSLVLGDANGNGTPDATACFGSEVLRPLFSHVSGSAHALTTIEFALRDGQVFRASLPVDVIGPDGLLRPLLAPNPLRPSGTFSFVTTEEGSAKLTLFDSHGRRVRTLLDVAALPTGYHDLPIDTRDANDHALPSGVYYYRLETAEGVRTGRLTLLR